MTDVVGQVLDALARQAQIAQNLGDLLGLQTGLDVIIQPVQRNLHATNLLKERPDYLRHALMSTFNDKPGALSTSPVPCKLTPRERMQKDH